MAEDSMYIWTIYKKGQQPFPDQHCARKWEVKEGKVIETNQLIHSMHLAEIRMDMQRRGLVCVCRTAEDDETVIESWI